MAKVEPDPWVYPFSETLLEFLRHCSRTELQGLELSRLNEAAEIRRELKTTMAQINATMSRLIGVSAEAMVARVLRDNFKSLREKEGTSEPEGTQIRELDSNPKRLPAPKVKK